jgi:hypothetical protein
MPTILNPIGFPPFIPIPERRSFGSDSKSPDIQVSGAIQRAFKYVNTDKPPAIEFSGNIHAGFRYPNESAAAKIVKRIKAAPSPAAELGTRALREAFAGVIEEVQNCRQPSAPRYRRVSKANSQTVTLHLKT